MLTERFQVQAIVNCLHGFETGNVPVTQLSEPWLTCFKSMQGKQDKQERIAALDAALKPLPECAEVLKTLLAGSPGPLTLQFQSLAEIAPGLPPIEWLWENWIPRGMITLLGALQGAGKSALALYLARSIIHEKSWPDGLPIPHPGSNVIFVDAEGIPQVHNQRADAWEMNKSKLFLFEPLLNEIMDLETEKYQNLLVEMVTVIRPELVIVDSFSMISTRGENDIKEVRNILAFLNNLARDFGIGLILIHHLRKKLNSQVSLADDLTIDDFRGSGHIIAMARSVIGLSVIQTSEEPNPNGPRKLKMIKTNLGPFPKPLGFELVPLLNNPKLMIPKWGNAPATYKPPTKEDECKRWLKEILIDGPLKPSEIERLGKDEGYPHATIYRARRSLGQQIKDTKGKKDPGNLWQWYANEEKD